MIVHEESYEGKKLMLHQKIISPPIIRLWLDHTHHHHGDGVEDIGAVEFRCVVLFLEDGLLHSHHSVHLALLHRHPLSFLLLTQPHGFDLNLGKIFSNLIIYKHFVMRLSKKKKDVT